MLVRPLRPRAAHLRQLTHLTTPASSDHTAHSLPKTPVFPAKKRGEGEPFAFVDYRRVQCRAGDGGNGSVSFLREKYVEFGGPDGGNGGNGGHVIFKADPHTKDLSNLSRLKARNGEPGASKCCHGKSAEHLEVKVPLCTQVRHAADGRLLQELREAGQLFLAARGGAGGHGNHFYLSNRVRKPTKAELGGEGERAAYALEMRVIASAGLIGFPNAGKSTLLRAISRAKPKVASYPFTTLKPHIGIVHYADYEQVAVADIPGLIEGAHRNVGLGFEFLRHVTRCHSLFFVLDHTLGSLREQFDALSNELHLYDPTLSAKNKVVVVNKVDLVQDKELDLERAHFPDHKLFLVSAKFGHGLVPLMEQLRAEYDQFVLEQQENTQKTQFDFV